MNSFSMIRQGSMFGIFVFRQYSTKVRIVAELPPVLYNDVETNVIKPRRHPGIIKSTVKSLPEDIEQSILNAIGDTPIKQLTKAGKDFNSYLFMRQMPTEDNQLKEKRQAIVNQVESSLNFNKEVASEEERKHHEQVVKSKVTNILKQRLYNWTSIDYTQHQSLVYLVARAAREYTVLMYVFNQLKTTLPEFKPKNLFDFGSGVGTVIWAAESTWNNSIKEYFCVDTSSHMNDLSSQIIQNSKFRSISSKIFHRQFFPASYDRQYDVVVSAYSLMELPSMSARLQTLHNLWNKTNKYLILVERGTKAYFNMLNEARDFILMNSRDEETNVHYAHIVAPCPHEFSCPRISTDDTPCNFTVQVSGKNNKGQGQITDELFTYIIFARGKREDIDRQWPRIVRPVLIRSGHCVCKLCTSAGRLELITFSSTKPNRSTYRCAKASKWGDLLPVDIKYITESDQLPEQPS